MSTKTTFKRIALATVTAMGFGLLSVVPANAAATDLGGSAVTVTAVSSSSVTSNTILKSAVYTAGEAITATINLATDNAMLDVLDIATVTVTVTGPSVAFPAATDKAVTSTLGVTRATAVTGLAFTTSGSTLIQSYLSGTPVKTAKPIGEVTFTPSIPGKYSIVTTTALTGATAAGTAKTVSFTVGGSTQLVPTVGTSISAANVVGAQTGGQATFRYQPTAPTAATITYLATVDTGSIVSVASSGASGTTGTVTTSSSNTNGLNTAGGVTLVGTLAGTYNSGGTDGTGIAPSYWDITVTSPVDATQTLLIKTFNSSTGAVTTVATAVATFGALPVANTALSTAFIGTGTAFATADATAGALRFPSTAAATVHANISVTLKDAAGVAINNQSISATVSGPGLISATAGNGTAQQGAARAVSITAAANTTNEFTIGISADGTRGVSTITVLRGTTVIATKTVTFYGAVATLTATQGVGIMRSGRIAASTVSDFVLGGTDATLAAASAITRATATNISIVAKDVDGNVVPLAAAPTAVVSDALVISAVAITSCAGGAALTVCAAGAGNYIASTTSAIGGVSGATATVTFRTPNPAVAGTFISTAALPFSLGGTALGGTVTMTTDKTTYAPGERINISYTAKDAAGNPVRDWTAVAAPSANKSVIGLAGDIFVGGKAGLGDDAGEYVYAPVSPGAFTLTLATGTATGAEITATLTVSDDAATTAATAASDAAAEATDAANAATDAANAAAEAADAATAAAQDAADAVAALSTSVTAMVNALKKQITALTNLVIKIQKKVRA